MSYFINAMKLIGNSIQNTKIPECSACLRIKKPNEKFLECFENYLKIFPRLKNCFMKNYILKINLINSSFKNSSLTFGEIGKAVFDYLKEKFFHIQNGRLNDFQMISFSSFVICFLNILILNWEIKRKLTTFLAISKA